VQDTASSQREALNNDVNVAHAQRGVDITDSLYSPYGSERRHTSTQAGPKLRKRAFNHRTYQDRMYHMQEAKEEVR
jgi:hypothetical protein